MTVKVTQIPNHAGENHFELNSRINIPINGMIPLHFDKLALKKFFKDVVNEQTRFFYTTKEKLNYLIQERYIQKDFIEKYSLEFIDSLYKKAVEFKFRFNSFMGAYKFFEQYALKSNDDTEYLERYEDHAIFVSLYLADGDEKLAEDIMWELLNRIYQPATPTFLNAGRERAGEMVSCFLISATDDMNSIARTFTSSLNLSKIGGGVGINLSNLREAGAPIKGYENRASGVVPVMKILEDCFSYANQLGQRNGAGVTYLSIFHPDIVAFLSAKKENADEKVRVKTLSLGVTIPDKFYELCEKNEDMYLFSPYSVEREYGVPFSYVDITKEYDSLVDNPKIAKYKVKAREIETELSKLQQESGYPYVINIDTVNRSNPIEGKVIMSNLCTEIMQVQEVSVLNDEQIYEELGSDISCNLGSLNLVNLVNSEDFAKSIGTAVKALTFVTDHSNINVVPTVREGNRKYHSIGLGAMGLHHLFAINKLEYGNSLSIELTDVLFEAINYYSIYWSCQIAKDRKETFYNFENSKYATGEYFNMYTQRAEKEISQEVLEILKNVPIPTNEDWKNLQKDVMEHGLYHAYRMAVAPTGSISYVNETTASLHPITQRIEERQEKKTGKTYYPAPDLSDETIPYYKTAYEIDMRAVIDIYATAQKHVDQGMSLTLFMQSEIPEGMYPWKEKGENKLDTRDLSILRNYAFKQGIKSLYYVRTFTPDGEIGGSNTCESCSI